MFGYRPDEPDSRDRSFALLSPRLGGTSSGEFVVPLKRTAKFQAGQTCVGNAWTRDLEILSDLTGNPLPELSANDLAWKARQRSGEQAFDVGTTLRAAAAALAKMGVATEAAWPSEKHSIGDQPPPAAWADAYDRRIASYHRIDSIGDGRLDDVELAVRSLLPVIGGVLVGQEMVSDGGADGSVLEPPVRTLGGHALCIVGVRGEGDGRNFLVLNSWGAWGIDGRGVAWISSAFLMAFIDLWTGTLE